MAFGGFNQNQQAAPMSDINVTPMVDVMLVLLVIFIITAPLFTHAIKLDLPAAQAETAPEKPETISLSINGEGKIFWGNDTVTREDLASRLAQVAQKKPQPELHLRADKATRYEVIAEVMAVAQEKGLTRMGFVTAPKPGAAKPAEAK
jgi:biopolymer transport protein ExbD